MVALAATALLFQGKLRDERAETARWRERAYEAEAHIALLRARKEPETPLVAAAPPGPAALAEPSPSAPPATQPAEEPAGEAPPPLDDPVWDALVAGHLASEVERMGRALAPEQEQRLLDRLRDVRDAGAQLDEDPGDDPLAGARRRLSRSIVLLEADRAFREELGMGLGEFLRELDGEQVEEVGEEPPPEPPLSLLPGSGRRDDTGWSSSGADASQGEGGEQPIAIQLPIDP